MSLENSYIPDIVPEDDLESGIFNMVDESSPDLGTIFTINSYGGFYEDLSYV